MTHKYHHIDKRVKDSFHEFRAAPPPGAWDRLDQAISGQKRGRLILLRNRSIMAAATVAVLIAGYFILFMNQRPDLPVLISDVGNAEVSPDKTEISPGSKEPARHNVSETKAALESDAISEQQNFAARVDQESDAIKIKNVEIEEHRFTKPALTQLEISEHLLDESIEFTAPVIPFKLPVISPRNYPEYLIADAATPGSESGYRWTVAGLAGQTYSNYYEAGGSRQPMDGLYQQDAGAVAREQFTHPLVSYGLTVDYQVTSRFGVASGLGVHYFHTPMIQEVSGLTILSQKKPVENAFGSVSFNDAGIQSALAKSPLIELYSGRLEQKFSYFEIPVTATYLIIDKQVGLGLKAGFGNNLLLENKVLFTDENISREMGYTEGLKNYYLSGILALDLYLKFRDKWQANFSPVYRHALQPVSNDPLDPHIFSFGLYSGVRFSF